MGVNETLLNEIVRCVPTVARPDKIILFGSAATGQMDSDIDLLIVEPVVENTRHRSVEKLLLLLSTANPAAAEALKGTAWLTPFGVDVRYADDAAQMLPGDEVKAIEDARLAKEVALRIVNSE